MASERKYQHISKVRYRPTNYHRQTDHKRSIQVYGADTEANRQGQCFMIATSLGDVFHPWDFPGCFFTRKYLGCNLVVYNLKYDSGALLQHLDIDNLKILQTTGEVLYDNYKYTAIAYKCLSIRKGKNTLTIFDMLNFYKMKLSEAAKQFLNESKIDLNPNLFTDAYVRQHWDKIARYCVQDAVLCAKLAEVLIRKFEAFGVYPQKLYSVAYVSFQYFMGKCPWVHVKRYWKDYKNVLDFAMRSYNGGKFEVTQKGPGYYYEYDIVSAYPYEIANLVDIRTARVEESKDYQKSAIYGFLECRIKVPYEVSSPLVLKRGIVNCYPIGVFTKVITKSEYDYLIASGCDITILKAYWLKVGNPQYPYRQAINTLMRHKDRFKRQGLDMDYHTVKIFLNSFYGKFVQLIDNGEYLKAGTSWNPIYGSIITSNCRVRISALQQKHPTVIAVHTDSIISTQKLDYPDKGKLGELTFEVKGDGLILGSGIYQIGEKSKFRGFDTKIPLIDQIPKKGTKLEMMKIRPYTWREVAHRSMALNKINRFEEIPRSLKLNFDSKRIWLDDYRSYSEVLKRNVESVPWCIDDTDS